MYGNIVAIHNIFLKNYIAKFSTSSIFKKISKYNFEKKIKKKRSQFWGKKEKTNVKKKSKKQRKKTCGES
jgi:cytochrome b subunit of formate dehydrogenase